MLKNKAHQAFMLGFDFCNAVALLRSFANIKIARDSVCSLILGSPAVARFIPSLERTVIRRLAERF